MKRLRKYLALPPAGRAIVLCTLLLLPIAAALLRARGMVQASTWLARLVPRVAATRGTLAPQEVARLVDAAASFLRVQCLPRSLLLWHFLQHRGVPAEIRLGVATPAAGKLFAHAWVELDGFPLNDRANVHERYAALPSIEYLSDFAPRSSLPR